MSAPDSEALFGFCWCGCNQKTAIASRGRAARGQVKGLPQRFIHGHTSKPNQPCPRKAIRPISPSIAYIPLSRGQFALVDTEDADALESRSWQAYWNKLTRSFYALRTSRRGGTQQVERMHATLGGQDHINPGRTLDNRRANLRKADGYQQAMNRRRRVDNKSGVTGVYWRKDSGKWAAQIKARGTTHRLGLFDSIDLARAAYRNAAVKLHGEFANLG